MRFDALKTFIVDLSVQQFEKDVNYCVRLLKQEMKELECKVYSEGVDKVLLKSLWDRGKVINIAEW
jgi:hypothetical protein